MTHEWIAGFATVATLFIAILTLFFKAGHLSARVEELEKWKPNVRADMHEISNTMEELKVGQQEVKTLILERTDRRKPYPTD